MELETRNLVEHLSDESLKCFSILEVQEVFTDLSVFTDQEQGREHVDVASGDASIGVWRLKIWMDLNISPRL